jgi:hypothetical protein
LLLALGDVETPAIVVDHDCHMIGVRERCSRPSVGRVVELPSRRRELPDLAVEGVRVGSIAGLAAFGREIE